MTQQAVPEVGARSAVVWEGMGGQYMKDQIEMSEEGMGQKGMGRQGVGQMVFHEKAQSRYCWANRMGYCAADWLAYRDFETIPAEKHSVPKIRQKLKLLVGGSELRMKVRKPCRHFHMIHCG